MIMIWLWEGHEMANGLDIYIYMIMMRFSDLWWWLCSTTNSYGQPVIEAAYREIMIHSTEVVWEILAREEWLRCYHDTSLIGRQTWFNTSVGTVYYIFWFHDINIYMYYVLKSICIIKKNTSGLWSRLGPTMFREGFQRPWVLKERETSTDID